MAIDSSRARGITLVAAWLSVGAAPVALAQRATLDRIIRRDSLANGLQVVVVENHSVPLAAATIVFRAGAITQTPDLQGVPHLFEHMLFKAYRGRGGRPFVWDAATIKASSNATTSDVAVSYYLDVPSDKLKPALSLLSGLVREPEFTDDALQTERFVVRGELQRHQSDPVTQLTAEVDRLLWGSYYHRKNVGGDDLSLFAVTTKQLETVFRTYYVPNNAALIVTGDVTADQAMAFARAEFGSWKRAVDPFVANPIPAPPPVDSTRTTVLTADITSVTLGMAWRAPSVTANPGAALDADVLADLANNPDSPFQKRLVDTGLWQSARFFVKPSEYGGSFSFQGVTRPELMDRALASLQGQLAAVADTGYFAEYAPSAAVRRRQVENALAFEQRAALGQLLGTAWTTGGFTRFIGYFDEVGYRTRADVAAFVRDYVLGRPYAISALTSPQHAPTVARLIDQFNELMSVR